MKWSNCSGNNDKLSMLQTFLCVYIYVQMWNIHKAHKNEPRQKSSTPNCILIIISYKYLVLTYVYYSMYEFIIHGITNSIITVMRSVVTHLTFD